MSSDRRHSIIHKERNDKVDKAFGIVTIVMVIAFVVMIICGVNS